MPDGFLDVTTSLATGAIAAGAVGLSLQRAEREVREAGAPLAGLTAAFVFAAQMVTFPVGAGTSGHLLGGALAAVLVGPWTGILALAVVVVVQALLFADGGLSALGTNVLLIGVVTVVVGWLVARAVLLVTPRRPASVVPAAAVGALVSVPAAALVFTGLYAVGGTVPVPLGTLAAAMTGWHLLIGIGEAAVTGAVVAAVVATRPDLVHLARRLRPTLEVTDAHGRSTRVAADVPAAGRAGVRPAALALALSLIVAGGVSLFASASPDGLQAVAQRLGFAGAERTSGTAASPLADYQLDGVAGSWLATTLAGVLGVLVTVAVAVALTRLVAARRGHLADRPAGRG